MVVKRSDRHLFQHKRDPKIFETDSRLVQGRGFFRSAFNKLDTKLEELNSPSSLPGDPSPTPPAPDPAPPSFPPNKFTVIPFVPPESPPKAHPVQNTKGEEITNSPQAVKGLGRTQTKPTGRKSGKPGKKAKNGKQRQKDGRKQRRGA